MKEIHYYDGSNNHYAFEKTTGKLVYDPITPIESSSGTYSGGQAWEQTLTQDQQQKFERLIAGMTERPDDTMDKRVMMSGLLKIIYEDRAMTMILSPRSPEKEQIEALLSGFKVP